MNISELNALLEKEASTPPGYDLLKDAEKIMSGDFPRMRRMKRRLAIESAAMMCVVLVCGGLGYTLPHESVWITAVVAAIVLLFLILEVLAFKAYWYTPATTSFADYNRKFSRRLNSITNPMKVINISLAMFIMILVIIDANAVRILTWEILILLLCLQAGLGLFSARWISYARKARRQATEFSTHPEGN